VDRQTDRQTQRTAYISPLSRQINLFYHMLQENVHLCAKNIKFLTSSF